MNLLFACYQEKGIKECLQLYLDNYFSHDQSVLIFSSLRKVIPINTENEFQIVRELENLLQVLHQKPNSNYHAQIVFQWYSRILSQSISSQTQSTIILSFLQHSILFSIPSITIEQLFQRIANLLSSVSPSSALRTVFSNEDSFILSLLHYLHLCKSTNLQVLTPVFGMIDSFTSWSPTILPTLANETTSALIVKLIKSIQWTSTYLRSFLQLLSQIYHSGRLFLYL